MLCGLALFVYTDNNNFATACDFQLCGILTSVDSDEPVKPLLSLETPSGVQSVA